MKEEKIIGVVGSSSIFVDGIKRILDRSGFRVAFSSFGPSSVLEVHKNPEIRLLLVVCPAEELHSYHEHFFEMRCISINLKIVVLLESLENSLVSEVWMSVDGVLSRTIGVEALIKALELVLLGERVLTGTSVGTLFGSAQKAEYKVANTNLHWGQLSSREVDVLHFLSAGQANKVIARQIGISEATVKVHVKAILRKLRARNRTEAAILARNQGFTAASATNQNGASIIRTHVTKAQEKAQEVN